MTSPLQTGFSNPFTRWETVGVYASAARVSASVRPRVSNSVPPLRAREIVAANIASRLVVKPAPTSTIPLIEAHAGNVRIWSTVSNSNHGDPVRCADGAPFPTRRRAVHSFARKAHTSFPPEEGLSVLRLRRRESSLLTHRCSFGGTGLFLENRA